MCGPPTVATNRTCTTLNPCYSAARCDGTGLCTVDPASARADGFVCQSNPCFDMQCETRPELPEGTERSFCTRLVPKVTCSQTGVPACSVNLCNPATGTCALSDKCVRANSCQNATCNPSTGNCTYTSVV